MAPKISLFRRITASVPLLVTVIIHIVLALVAGYFVSEQVIGKKKVFEATAASDASIAQKQVEHRLQVARKGGGSASSSPVSASRIFSTADNALQMPAMPDLPSTGASSLSGMGFGSGVGGAGTGAGYNTGLGTTGGLGSGFMSMSFLGVTNQRSSKVVFVVDISGSLMDIRKGGFRAFEILRQEISRLVSTLPATNEFNVVFFDGENVRLFSRELRPATVTNKTEFFEWIKPINSELSLIGVRSIPRTSTTWYYKPADSLKLDPVFTPPSWVNGVNAALEQKPDTLFVITGSAELGKFRVSEQEIARREREKEEGLAEFKKQGIDLAAVVAAREKAMAKLRNELDEINRKLVAQKKPPFVVGPNVIRVTQPDFQAALRLAGFSPLVLDTTGWTDKAGKPIWANPDAGVTKSRGGDVLELAAHLSKLQFGLLPKPATLNLFLFTGPDEKSEADLKNLSALARRNGGSVNLLTTKRLEELVRREEDDGKKS